MSGTPTARGSPAADIVPAGGVGPDKAADARQAAMLFAIDPVGLGGIVVRGLPGPVRDGWLSLSKNILPAEAPLHRVPTHTSVDRLLGGLDLTATLNTGRPVQERGLLAAIDGGFLILPMAERLPASSAALIATAQDTGEVRLERDGFTRTDRTRFGVIALDESLEDEDRPSTVLRERLAFEIDLDCLSHRDWHGGEPSAPVIAAARRRLFDVAVDDELIEAMTGTALALGIGSLRVPLFAIRAAAAAAALAGRTRVDAEDAALAVRLTLAHRATSLPPLPEDEDEPPAEEPETPDDMPSDEDAPDPDDGPLEDRLLAAALAALPPGLLASLRLGAVRSGSSAGKAGVAQKSGRRGRPAGFRRGRPSEGQRLDVIETLRAAAPWQQLRRRQRSAGASRRLDVRADDLRIVRRKERSRTTTIFAVDASGSSALERLAESKGAVELLLAECYTRRDQVALLAFRGERAELLLPPTRSLVRAKRCLSALPGGGGTPLAAGVEVAAQLADAARRRGETPLLVFLTDGRANIGRDGKAGRKQALADALAAAKSVAATGDAALVIDISTRPGPEAAALAAALNARYLPLPKADARRLSDMVTSARSG